jgi:hypothetical protein
MVRLIVVAVSVLLVAACPDPGARDPGEPLVEAVEMDTLSWVQEGRPVELQGSHYAPVGPPVHDLLELTHVGEFEGTPLYAERAATGPHQRLFVPVGGGYWQTLEQVERIDPASLDPEDVPGMEGVDPGEGPVVDPQGTARDPDPRP